MAASLPLSALQSVPARSADHEPGEEKTEKRPSFSRSKTQPIFGPKGRKSLKDAAKIIMTESYGINALKEEIGTSTRSSNSPKGVSEEEKKRIIARSFLRFTPAILHHWFNNGDSSQNIEDIGGMVKQYSVAMLLIDVSGFTKMSVKLGAELTRKHTSMFFDHIILCIKRYGGDVLKFLGDALLVVWPTSYPASDETQQHLARAAATCAAEVMTTLNGYHITDDITLTLHGGLAIGDIFAFDVGSIERREFLVGGALLGEIGDMESEATSGQLVMSKKFADFLPDNAHLMHLESGNVRLNMESMRKSHEDMQSMISDYLDLQFGGVVKFQDDNLATFATSFKPHLEAHVPKSCINYVEELMLDDLGELRHVTTLFLAMDFLVPHLNSGDVYLVQESFLRIIEGVRETNGAIRQFVLDDKGCVAICAWGLHHAAHGCGRDAELSIKCAFHIIQGLDSLVDTELGNSDNVVRTISTDTQHIAGPHIGIAAGLVYVGLIGASQRCEFAMVGPSVNLAARLMGKAKPWQVLVEDAVRKHAQEEDESWIFHEKAPVQAKGYDQKVPVFVPDAPREFSSKPHTFLDEYKETFELMYPEVQIVIKVASVLADGPDGHSTDFPLRALLYVFAETLKIATDEKVKSAMVQLKARCLIRLTRGARRGNPSFAFADEDFRKWVQELNTREYTAKVHGAYAQWIEHKIDHAKQKADKEVDPVVRKASLRLLHIELDAKLEYHRTESKGMVNDPMWFLRVFQGCCTTREDKDSPEAVVLQSPKVRSD
jgi:class 3 adenylate cyclase